MEATQGGDDNGLDVAILAIGDFQIFRRFFIGSVIRVLVTVVFVGRNGGVGNGIDGTHVKNGAVGVVSEKHKAVGLLSVCLFAIYNFFFIYLANILNITVLKSDVL